VKIGQYGDDMDITAAYFFGPPCSFLRTNRVQKFQLMLCRNLAIKSVFLPRITDRHSRRRFLANRTNYNGRAIGTVLRLSVCRL